MTYETLLAITAELKAAVDALPKVRVYSDLGAVVDPPAAVLSPPTLTWETQDLDPTSATFSIALVVDANERATEVLLALLPDVVTAIDEVRDVVVLSAAPGTLPFGTAGSELPAYLIQIEVSL